MSKYEVIIYWSEDDEAFVAERFLSWQDVWLMAQHTRRLWPMQKVIIQEWLETARQLGRPIPGPKGRLIYA
jgi:predicted RNase H-like HicB family nuclease